MSTVASNVVRGSLLSALVVGGLASSAPAQAIASPDAAAVSRLVHDACELVEPDSGPESSAALGTPPELKWKHARLGRGTQPAMSVSGAGQPHVVFAAAPGSSSDPDKRVLKHARLDGNKWRSETIYSMPGPGHIGNEVALAIGSDGILHVAFRTWHYPDPGVLHHAWSDGAGWQTETVEADDGGAMSIAIDEAGLPHILHLNGGSMDDVRYLSPGPGGWTGETIDGSHFPNHGASLQFHQSKVYATYLNENGQLTMAVGDGEDWTTDVISIHGNFSTLAIDEAGTPHAVYYESKTEGGKLTHAWLTEEGWSTETLVGPTTLFGESAPPEFVFVGEQPVITADASGRLRLAFGLTVFKGNKFGKALTVALLEDGAWLPSIAGQGRIGYMNSIVADPAGIVHVATVKVPLGDGPDSVQHYRLLGSKLSLSVYPKAAGSIGVAPLDIEATGKTSVNVFPGDPVTLTATPATGFEFAGWSGAASGTDPVVEVTMDHSAKVVARFVPTLP